MRKLILGGLLGLLSLQGCVAVNTFPTVARSGDTITLAVGSPEGMTKLNTTAVYTPDGGSPITLNIRSIFKLFADKSSSLYFPGSELGVIENNSRHHPWLTVVVVDLPPSIQPGSGQIQITTGAIYDNEPDINTTQIDLTIIDGVGQSSSFDYHLGTYGPTVGNLDNLEPNPYAAITPPAFANTNPYYSEYYGAIEFTIGIQTQNGATLSYPEVRLVFDDLMISNNSRKMTDWQISGGNQVVVRFIATSQELLQYYQTRFSIVLNDNNQHLASPVVTSITYFDIEGNEVAGPLPGDYLVSLHQ